MKPEWDSHRRGSAVWESETSGMALPPINPPCQSAQQIPHTPQQKVPGSAPSSLAVDLMRCEKEEGRSTL